MPHPIIKDRPEPKLAAPSVAPMRGPARGDDVTPFRLGGEARRAERPATAFTAGDRLAVSSAIAGDDGPRPRRSMFRLTLLLILLFFAGIGAVTVYHAVAAVLPH